MGQTLSVTNGTWSATPTSYLYQWRRASAVIGGATANTYVLVTADAGQLITCNVVALNASGAGVATSNALGPVADPAQVPANSSLPVITGTAQSGQTLSTTNGLWTNSPTSYAYQWKRDGVAITGATSSTYVLQSADVTTTTTVTVTATNAFGSAPATATGVGPIGSASGLTAPTLTRTSAAGTDRMSWQGSYPSSIQWDGSANGDKIDMQWRVTPSGGSAGAWQADTRQPLDSATLLSGSVPWPLFSVAAFAINDLVEVQERKVRYSAGVVVDFSPWSSPPLSDTMATATAFDPATLFGAGDVGYVWNPTDLAQVWQSIAGTTPGAFTSPVGRLVDLSGKGNNLNATADNTGRPTLVNVNNGMVSFDGSNDQLQGSAGFYAKGAMTWVGAIKGLDSGAHILWAENSSSLSVPSYSPGLRANGNTTQMLNFQKNDAGTQIANAMAVPLMDNAIHVYFVVDTGTQVQVSIDGGAFVTNSYTRSGSFTMNLSSFGTSTNANANLGGFAAFNLGAGIAIGRNLGGTLGTAGSERTKAYNYVAAKHGLTLL